MLYPDAGSAVGEKWRGAWGPEGDTKDAWRGMGIAGGLALILWVYKEGCQDFRGPAGGRGQVRRLIEIHRYLQSIAEPIWNVSFQLRKFIRTSN